MTPLLETACHAWHVTHGGRMVEFAGWDMPVQYVAISPEHMAVRKHAGLFDIAHMGRIRFTGPDAEPFVDRLVTNDIPRLRLGQVCYALICREDGGVLDDVLVYRLDGSLLMVVNASNRIKILDWIARQRPSFAVQVDDLTTEQFMFALQGPAAAAMLQPLVDLPLNTIAYFEARPGHLLDEPALISRTGYTGEDGFEVIVAAAAAEKAWKGVLSVGIPLGLLPAGLGCRDTLRLEAGMPLYGHELSEEIDPLAAGLGFAVKLEAGDFIGREALRRLRSVSGRPRRVGLELGGKRIAREGASIMSGETVVGRVTSGTFSPTLDRSIAMGYLAAELAQPDTPVEVDIRGKREPARIVRLPFYKRPARV